MARYYIARNLQQVRDVRKERGKEYPTWDELERIAENIDREILIIAMGRGGSVGDLEAAMLNYDRRMDTGIYSTTFGKTGEKQSSDSESSSEDPEKES